MISDELKQLICDRYKELGSLRKVAAQFEVADISVRNIVHNRYVANHAKRGPKKTTSRDKTRILRTVKKLTQNGERVTSAKVRDRCDVSHISTRTI